MNLDPVVESQPQHFISWQLVIFSILFLIGLVIAGYGLYELTHFTRQPCFIEENVLEASNSALLTPSRGFIYVDVAGAVEQPGIYQLPLNSRLAALIKKAGGFSKKVDQTYLAQELNLAKRLQDGDKIYIFSQVETDYQQTAADFCQQLSSGVSKESGLENLISINQASIEELESLESIGEKRAEEIVSNRPYDLLTDLVTKEVLTENLFNKLENYLKL